MNMLIMNAANPAYGILSCNYNTSKFRGMTMSEVAKKDTGKITGQDDGFIQASKKRRDAVHMGRVPIPAVLAKLTPSVARAQLADQMRRDMALDAYLDVFPELREYADIGSMTVPERAELADILVGYWRSGKMESFVPRAYYAISDAPNEMKLADGVSIAEHTRNDISKDRKRLINGLIDSMSKSISLRLTEPEFTKTLLRYEVDATGMLPFTVDTRTDPDVLEQLNIRLLSRVRVRLSEYDVGVLINENEDVMMKVLRSMLRTVIVVNRAVNQKMNTETKINDAFIRIVLDTAFPGCDDTPIIPTVINPQFIKVLAESAGFEGVNPSSLWEFFVGFALAYEMQLPQSRNVDREGSQISQIVTNVLKKIELTGVNESTSQASRIRDGGATIYTIDGCKWCKLAKAVVLNYGFSEVLVETDDDVPESVRRNIKGVVTYPIVMVGSDYIGGFTELDKLLKKTPVQRRPTRRGFSPDMPMVPRIKTAKAVVTGGVVATAAVAQSLGVVWNHLIDGLNTYGAPFRDIADRSQRQITTNINEATTDIAQRFQSDATRAIDKVYMRIMDNPTESFACGASIAVDGGSRKDVFEMARDEILSLVSASTQSDLLRKQTAKVARALAVEFLRPMMMSKFDEWYPDMELDIVIERPFVDRTNAPSQNIALSRSIACSLASSDGMTNFWLSGSNLITKHLGCQDKKSVAQSCPRLSRDLNAIFGEFKLSLDANVEIVANTMAGKFQDTASDAIVDIRMQSIVLMMFMVFMLARKFVMGNNRLKIKKAGGYAPVDVDADIDRFIASFSV